MRKFAGFVMGGLLVALLLSLAAPCQVVTPPSASSVLPLPAPDTSGVMPLETALRLRRSVRGFQDQPLSLEQIGQLLWAAQGITEPTRGLRTAPSAGATYPLEVYVATAEGLLHYLPQGHRVERVKSQDLRPSLSQAASGQASVRKAGAVFVLCAVMERTATRYGDRATEFALLETGHVAQNLLLEASALRLGAVPVGAFSGQQAAQALGLPASHSVPYLIPVGVPAG